MSATPSVPAVVRSKGTSFRRIVIVGGVSLLALWVFGQLGGLTPIREGLEDYAANARKVSKKEAKRREKAAKKARKAAKKQKPVLTDRQKRVAAMVARSQANLVSATHGIANKE